MSALGLDLTLSVASIAIASMSVKMILIWGESTYRSVNFESKLSSLEFFQKRPNEFVFTTMRCVFVCFLEEIEDTKKTFRN